MPLSRYLTILLLPLLCACAALQKPRLDYTPGAVVETLSSAVALSVHATDHAMAGNGYLVYRRPDQVRLVVLSPFGTTLFELFALGERIVLVYPSQATAYSGRFDELPDRGGAQGWRLLRWVLEIDPPAAERTSATVERMGRQGFIEKVQFENGLVTAKSAPGGEQVFYTDYALVSGVPLAGGIELRDGRDGRILLRFDEPEVNTPLDDGAFTPRLDGMTILPLSAIQGL
ncbi:MAG: outer membrane lipoprotein LolB [Deltaproteobacteria bacterium]|nr:outer membrane lipoprotein LolB [Deltaproteobacteria bacterium]